MEGILDSRGNVEYVSEEGINNGREKRKYVFFYVSLVITASHQIRSLTKLYKREKPSRFDLSLKPFKNEGNHIDRDQSELLSAWHLSC